MEHHTRCLAVLQAINLHPDSYLLPTSLVTLMRNAVYDTSYHHPDENMVRAAEEIMNRIKQNKEWDK